MAKKTSTTAGTLLNTGAVNQGTNPATAGMSQAYYAKTNNNENGFLPPEEDLNEKDLTGEIGQSGTLIFTGFISGEEYNPDLSGRTGIKIYEQMRRSDATVRASLQVMKLPILAAEWDIEPAEKTAEAETIAEFVRHCLFDNIRFHEFAREALTFLEFGHSVFELVFEPEDWEGRTMVGLSKLGSRKQATILRWQTDENTAGITQQTYSGGMFSIPRQKLAIFSHEQEGDNYEGVSILRSSYKHWYIKDNLYKIDAIAHERQGVGIPKLIPPEDGADEPSKAKARSALRNLRSNEQAYIEMPKGWDIEFMDMKAHGTMDPLASITHHDRQIMMNVLAAFMELGQSKAGGSRALSTDLSRLFELGLEAIAEYLREVINDDVIKRIVDLNFTTDKYPTLEHGKLADDNIETMGKFISLVSGAGMLTPDADLEQWIRDTIHAPELPIAYRKDYNNRPRPQAAMVPDLKDPATEDNDNIADQDTPVTNGQKVEATDLLSDIRAFRDGLGAKIDALDT